MINKFFSISIIIGTSLVTIGHLPKANALPIPVTNPNLTLRQNLERKEQWCIAQYQTVGLTPRQQQACQLIINGLNDIRQRELINQTYIDNLNRGIKVLEDAANAHVGG